MPNLTKCPRCFKVINENDLIDEAERMNGVLMNLQDDEPLGFACPECFLSQTAANWSANVFAIQPSEPRRNYRTGKQSSNSSSDKPRQLRLFNT